MRAVCSHKKLLRENWMGDKPRILVVEDNTMNRKLFHDLLVAHGYGVVEATTGMEAIELAMLHRPDLVILDIQLPEVSGVEVLRWLKEEETLKDVPVVAVTAFAMKGDEARLKAAGCDAYIPKPITIQRFIRTVGQFIPAPPQCPVAQSA